MEKNRLEAFSDGVIAVIITIMVLEMKVPHGAGLAALAPLWPVFLSYVLSFVYIGIYWNNHHHMLKLIESISGAVLWANLPPRAPFRINDRFIVKQRYPVRYGNSAERSKQHESGGPNSLYRSRSNGSRV